MKHDAPVTLCDFCEEGSLAIVFKTMRGIDIGICWPCLDNITSEFKIAAKGTRRAITGK